MKLNLKVVIACAAISFGLPVIAGSIWSASTVSPSATDRIPVDVSSSGSPSQFNVGSLDTYLSASTQALTNKTVDGDLNTVQDLPLTAIKTVIGDASKLLARDASGIPVSMTMGTGVITALGINVGSAGAPVVNGGALGTPSSGTLTSATGLPLTTGVTGTLAFGNGGTGLATAADDTVPLSSGSAWVASAIANCTDTGGNHLNYTAATNAFSCGTSSGAGGVTGFTAAANTASPNNTINVSSLTSAAATTHGDIAMVPKGASGGLLAAIPDSGTGGGNRRGANAVDWQTVRSAAGQVASGPQSTISGGSGNAATGTASVIVGGLSNVAGGSYSVIGGYLNTNTSANYVTAFGLQHTISGAGCAISGGNGSTCSDNYASIGGGDTNTASGAYSRVGGGTLNTASGIASTIPGGIEATTRNLAAALAYSSGKKSVLGDSQWIWQVVSASTTDATATVLTADEAAKGSTTVMVIPAGSSVACSGVFVSRSGASTAAFTIGPVWAENASGTTTMSGTAAGTAIGTPDAALSTATMQFIADDTLDAIEAEITGVAATNIHTSGTLKCEQVI